MRDIRELKNYEIANIVKLLKESEFKTKDIVSGLFDGNWKYCGSDEELRDAYKELYGKEFISDEDFHVHVRFSRGIIFLDSGEKNEYLIKANRKVENNNVYTLSQNLKSEILFQLVQKGLEQNEIADILYTQHEGYEWKYCEDFLDLKETIECGIYKYTSTNPIITLHDTNFSDSYLVCCKLH